MARRNLCAQIALALLGSTYIVQQQGQHVTIHHAGAHDLHGRNSESFLIDFAAKAHRSRVRSSHVGMVGSGSYVEVGMVPGFWRTRVSAPHVHRGHQRYVGKMSASAKGIVEHDY